MPVDTFNEESVVLCQSDQCPDLLFVLQIRLAPELSKDMLPATQTQRQRDRSVSRLVGVLFFSSLRQKQESVPSKGASGCHAMPLALVFVRALSALLPSYLTSSLGYPGRIAEEFSRVLLAQSAPKTLPRRPSLALALVSDLSVDLFRQSVHHMPRHLPGS